MRVQGGKCEVDRQYCTSWFYVYSWGFNGEENVQMYSGFLVTFMRFPLLGRWESVKFMNAISEWRRSRKEGSINLG